MRWKGARITRALPPWRICGRTNGCLRMYDERERRSNDGRKDQIDSLAHAKFPGWTRHRYSIPAARRQANGRPAVLCNHTSCKYPSPRGGSPAALCTCTYARASRRWKDPACGLLRVRCHLWRWSLDETRHELGNWTNFPINKLCVPPDPLQARVWLVAMGVDITRPREPSARPHEATISVRPTFRQYRSESAREPERTGRSSSTSIHVRPSVRPCVRALHQSLLHAGLEFGIGKTDFSWSDQAEEVRGPTSVSLSFGSPAALPCPASVTEVHVGAFPPVNKPPPRPVTYVR